MRAARLRSRPARKSNKDPRAAARPLTPEELSVGKLPPTAPSSGMDSDKPGNNVNYPIMSPSQLGWNGSIGNLFGGNKPEVGEFKGEPPRSSLVEPPVGYQTPSPNFAYGTGPRESLNKGYYDVVAGDRQSLTPWAGRSTVDDRAGAFRRVTLCFVTSGLTRAV